LPLRRPPVFPLFPYTRSSDLASREAAGAMWRVVVLFLLQPVWAALLFFCLFPPGVRVASGTLIVATAGASTSAILTPGARVIALDRKSTRLNSSHVKISYAVF